MRRRARAFRSSSSPDVLPARTAEGSRAPRGAIRRRMGWLRPAEEDFIDGLPILRKWGFSPPLCS
eukprot:8307787-Alexandrium_andersonii.AAC.1